MIFLTLAKNRVKSGKINYNTLIIGGDKNAVELYEEITNRPYSLGFHFVGFIDSNGKSKNHLEAQLNNLGKINDLALVIEEKEIEEVIVAVETSEHDQIKDIFDILFDFSNQIIIKVIPDLLYFNLRTFIELFFKTLITTTGKLVIFFCWYANLTLDQLSLP